MKELRIIPSAEQVHNVVDKTKKIGICVTAGGAIVGVLPVSIGGTIGWGVSVGIDKLATYRIRHKLSSEQVKLGQI